MKKFIIWGHPLHSHTHSYVNGGMFKALKALGREVYWFTDKDHPNESDFDYENSIFFTEAGGPGTEEKIPLNKTSDYLVHCCINPKKYLEKECRLIDVRFNVKRLYDVNYNFTRDGENTEKINDCLYYARLKDDSGLTNRQFPDQEVNYEAIYLTWATDLLPEEIKDEFIDIPKENNIYWLGSLGGSNINEIRPFAQAAAEKGVQFIENNPWNRPLSFEDCMRLTQVSYLAPDLRGSGDSEVYNGTNHLENGYVACRQFKNISYGQLGMTNSAEAQRVFEGSLIYNSNSYDLFHEGEIHKRDKNLILNQMKLVREKHTWKTRTANLIKLVEET